ncbi:hypothetical protein [Mucilaginibacter terrae]|uniref:PNPLA domain-containing protein n=1 Tax=Mucilaginibacter terrae TaxID=1955052 RepID=A0ABU3GN67_9SPHI|nr:hypothetical protein [Mucilaginibacter terrae]MDT3401219.1 hypothetical protein [Mucilaginibacter terrae]
MKKLLTLLLGPVVESLGEIKKEKKGIGDEFIFRDVVADFLRVTRNAGFVLIPAILSGFIFLALPQGRDTILLVVEKMDSGDYWQLLFFIIAMTIWSMSAEFSVRYATSIADNSGKSLRDSRVYSRKLAQRFLAAFCLFAPGLFILISLISIFNNADYMSKGTKILNFLTFGLFVLSVLRLLSELYFRRFKRTGNAPAATILGARSLPVQEYQWINRLYGIYNEYVFDFPKPTNFKGIYKRALATFTRYITSADLDNQNKFPKNPDVMSSLRIVDENFELINSGNIYTRRGDRFKWRYKIPNRFFKKLHFQLRITVFTALTILLFFSLVPASSNIFSVIGAPALLAFAFASYSGIYSGLLYLDYGWKSNRIVSIRFALVILLAACSYYNQDHPVKMADMPNPLRPTAVSQFNTWFRQYKSEMDKAHHGIEKYPVVFICAEGGAFRTGAFTSLYLTRLQKEMQQKGYNFKRSIFSLSGVSGGALGLSYYNAKAFGAGIKDPSAGSDMIKAISFYKYDSLSPIIGKMLFGEFLNLFFPVHIPLFDRAAALEDSWQQAYECVRAEGEANRFAQDFISTKTELDQPVLIINTAEVESGYQCWISNVQPDSLAYRSKRDLLAGKVRRISYSTGVNFSTRFPLFSPAAKIDTIAKDTIRGRFHYIDGGYVENTGAGSTAELLELLKKRSPFFRSVIPVVIYLRFSNNDNTGAKNIRSANELFEIICGIYNTRIGRSFTSMAQVNQFVKEHNGILIDQPLDEEDRDVPMNWMLSDQSIKNLLRDLDKKFSPDSPKTVKKRLFERDAKYLPINSQN